MKRLYFLMYRALDWDIGDMYIFHVSGMTATMLLCFVKHLMFSSNKCHMSYYVNHSEGKLGYAAV